MTEGHINRREDLCCAELYLVDLDENLRWEVVRDPEDGGRYRCTITWKAKFPPMDTIKEVGTIGRGETRTQAVTRAVSKVTDMMRKHWPVN